MYGVALDNLFAYCGATFVYVVAYPNLCWGGNLGAWIWVPLTALMRTIVCLTARRMLPAPVIVTVKVRNVVNSEVRVTQSSDLRASSGCPGTSLPENQPTRVVGYRALEHSHELLRVTWERVEELLE